jgi:Bacterial membrane protein YfhO
MSCVEDSSCAIADLSGSAASALDEPRATRTVASQRWLSAWILLAAAACFTALAAPFFAGRVYVRDDLGEFHLPVRSFYAEQLARGEPFDWMPSLFGGFYIAAEGQLGAYHPWHLLLYRFLPLGAAFDVELLASYPFLFAGTYLFFRRLVSRRDAALLGALAFTFGGFNLLHFVHPNAIGVVAHLPWLLLAIDVALSATGVLRRAAAELGLGLLTASQLLLGYPQYVWFSLLAEGAFVAWRVAGNRIPLSRLATIALAVSLGAAAGAIQWLPTLHLLGTSTRQSSDTAFAASGSLHPLNLVQLLAPYLFEKRVVGQNTHELGLYVGAVPIVLCIWLLAHRRAWGRYRPLVRALIVFGGLALLLAAGEFGGLYRLQSLVPIVNRFRFPCRAIVLFELAIAAGAAVAAAILLERKGEKNGKPRDRALLAAFLASVVLAIAGPIAWPSFVARGLLVWTGPLLVGAAAGLVALTERGVRGAAILLVLFTAVDLGVYGLSYSVFGRTANLKEFSAVANLPPGENNPRVAAPDEPGGPRVGNRMLLGGVSRIDGYAGLEPAKKLDYRQRRARQLAGAEWVLEPADRALESDRTWSRVERSAPRARLATKTLGPKHLDDVKTIALDAAVVDPPESLPPSEPGSAQVVADRPGRITIETDSPTRQLLVTTESFDSGWQVTIDGRPNRIVRVNGDFLGCGIEAGEHRVDFRFRPRCRRLGALVSGCSLGLIVAAACFSVFWRRRRDNEDVECRDPL